MLSKCAQFGDQGIGYFRIRTANQFNGIVSRGEGFVVILDTVNGDKVHLPRCPFVTLKNFMEKVIDNEMKYGCYYVCDNADDGRRIFSARDCPVCWK